MTAHAMKVSEIPGATGLNNGYKLYMAEQVTDAAVANNDTLVFSGFSTVIPISIRSEIGSVIDFDANITGTLTVNTTVITTGTAATSVKGLVLAIK